MIRTKFHIVVNGNPWYITIFLPITRYHVSEIMDALYSIGISEDNYRTALDNLTSGRINNGITYSSIEFRQSISIWARCENKVEYFGLLIHELHHLSVQIASMNGLDLEGEEVCYINEYIAKYLYNLCKPLIT
jgi:hypothetical protein